MHIGVGMKNREDKETELLKDAIEIMRWHLLDTTAMRETACHVADEMKRIITEYEKQYE